MADKPLCPYCGPWNGHPDGVDMVRRDDGDPELDIDWFLHECPSCGSTAPKGLTENDALASALRRFQPMQKPLTLEEVHTAGAVFVETDSIDGYVLVQSVHESLIWLIFDDGDKVGYDANEYGKSWRCWHERPTRNDPPRSGRRKRHSEEDSNAV